jgi:hypothetical protein
MLVARRTARRSPGSALWSRTAAILLYLYDIKQALRRVRHRQ